MKDRTRLHRRLDQLGFRHGSVAHSRVQYVKETVHGSIHTAKLDSFWSPLKRGIVGTFHKVSADYLPLYLNECSFRHTHRNSRSIFVADVAGCAGRARGQERGEAEALSRSSNERAKPLSARSRAAQVT